MPWLICSVTAHSKQSNLTGHVPQIRLATLTPWPAVANQTATGSPLQAASLRHGCDVHFTDGRSISLLVTTGLHVSAELCPHSNLR
jgi:hypothetical protein